MKKRKRKYNVMVRRRVEIESEDPVVYPWEPVGETWAVSEKQAINNCRFREGGMSQYMPVQTAGHYEVWVDWKAVEDGADPNAEE